MSSGESERSAAGLTALPSLEQLQRAGDGYEEQSVREAFDAFRRHTAQLQAQLRVLQAARKTANVEPTGHAVRMDALHLIRAAAEFADVLERDAQSASASQLQRTEEEVRAKQRELREAETRGNRLLEQSRHQATELTNSARAEVEQTLEWARAQATAVMARAQKGAEQLLAAAGLGEPAIAQVVQSIMDANESEMARSAPPPPAARPVEPVAAPAAEPEPEEAPEPLASEDDEPAAPPVTPTADAEEAPEEPAEDGEPDRET